MGIDHLLTSVLLPTGDFRHIGPLTGTSFSFSIKILLYINNDKHSNATFLNVKFFTIYPDMFFVKYIPHHHINLIEIPATSIYQWEQLVSWCSHGPWAGGLESSFSMSLQVPQPHLNLFEKKLWRGRGTAEHDTALEKWVWTNELCWHTYIRKQGNSVVS